MPEMNQQFVAQLMQIGIVSYREQETLFNIAQRCAKTTGVPMAGAGMVIGSEAGAIPGAVAGALIGLLGGTITCALLNVGMRDQLRMLANGE